ncbi:hypothetical protein [Pontibacter cellulosilyticus]|uniref:Uncharacterized protein n=1 Tax=Pontibacter cellulosilyticus TaxID=1720253 RepID=A0A923NB75_9BACT|nr:hypothetical protein [Pontibacter cellulosilyticus]MBC5994711.1 hypothetical protein [Pontibacter cellulosilyticus]
MDERLKYIGWYQIAGGVIGIGLTLWLVLTTETMSNLTVLVILLALGLYSFSIYSGNLLTKPERIEKGIKLTIVHQLLQVFYISLFGMTYQYYSGFQLSVGMDLTNSFLFKFNFSFSGFNFSYNPNADNLIVMLNIVPLILISFLEKVRSKKTEIDMHEPKHEKVNSMGR